MKITIAKRFHPFSHVNGTSVILPHTTWRIQVFPTRVYFTDLENRHASFEMAFDFVGPIKDFTAELDVEKGELRVFGKTQKGFMRFVVRAKEDGVWLTGEKIPPGCLTLSKEPRLLFKQKVEICAHLERLSLGMHKSQEWELMRRRLDFKEIFPLWLKICTLIPQVKNPHSEGGNYALLKQCQQSIDKKDRVDVLQAFEAFFLSAFQGILTPRLFDTEHQGILAEDVNASKAASLPLPLLTEGGHLVRSLFFQDRGQELSFLPCLPASFACGRMTGIKTSRGDEVDFEWTKNFMRRMRITSVTHGDLHLKLPKGIVSFRVKKGRTTMKKVAVDREGRASLSIDAPQTLHLDRFES